MIGSDSPKLFYTPNEITDTDNVIKINFYNSKVANSNSLVLTQLMYTKTHLKNAKYEYIYIQEGQEKLFRKIYLQEQRQYI